MISRIISVSPEYDRSMVDMESPREKPDKEPLLMRLTPVSVMHYVKLVYRAALFLAAIVFYVFGRTENLSSFSELLKSYPVIFAAIWLVFAVEMLFRFFPSRLESPGCQKQFAANYVKTGKVDISIQDNNAAVLVALVWIGFNAVFGALKVFGVIDDGILLLIACAYSVCDMICILFFCPFQTLFLKNKCCSSCRIYNWDYAMMFTPMVFVKSIYAWSLVALSFGLLLRWEITIYKHPERFSEATNDYLNCRSCTEKLCTHKKQLHSLWKHIAEFTAERVRKLKK